MLDNLFMAVLDMSKDACVVILVVLLARWVLHRVPKVFSYLLWGIVLFRLLCPVSLESECSLLPEFTSVSQSYNLADAPVNILGAGEAAYRAIGDAVNGGLGIQHIRTTQVSESGNRIYVSSDWWDVWILFGQYVWIIGAVGMLTFSGHSYVKLCKHKNLAEVLQDNIYILEGIPTAFVAGLIRPRIYLPAGIAEEELHYIICHEQYHIKRRDYLLKLLAYFALCIHWFNPLVWVAYRLACKDMEMSCDEAVLRQMGEEVRADYAASLLHLASGSAKPVLPPAFGEGDTKGRIKNLVSWKKPSVWIISLSLIICLMLALCLMTNPRKKVPGAESIRHMIPTEAELEGVFDNYLYLPLEGKKYRYECVDILTEDIGKGALLYEFTESLDFEEGTQKWKVYAVEGQETLSEVYAVTTDYAAIYRYSPSKRSEDNALEQARASECVLMEDGDVTAGTNIWLAFVEKTEAGQSAHVQVAHYYTLKEENCDARYYEAYKEDYPILYLQELFFNGENYTIRWQEGEKEYQQTYRYLMHYTGKAESATARYDTYSRYVLTNDNTVTWEDLLWGLASSRSGDYIPHYSVYTDFE